MPVELHATLTGHLKQLDWADMLLNVPTVHGVGLVKPVAEQKVPVGHGALLDRPLPGQ